MKIVYCIAGTFNSGGMERVLANKANYLVQLGYDLTIITTDQQGRKPYFELDRRIGQIDLDINYHENINSKLFRKMLSYVRKQRSHKRRLEELLDKLSADVVISMFDHEVSFLHKINEGSRKILEIHFSRFKRLQYGRKGLWRKIDQCRSALDLRLVKKYDRFVVLTQEDAGYWGDLKNIQVIPNANSFESENTAALVSKRVIAVGRYDYQKGFDDLIRIWSTVHEKFPDWTLDIFGHGDLAENFHALIGELKLSSSIHLRPPVKDIKQEYLNSSLLVMTSRYEGFGMVLTEANACGVPVVSYACKCGPRDIIADGENGFLIAEGDRESFAEKTKILLSDSKLRKEMGIHGKAMSTRYTEERVMKEWISLFNDISGR